MLIKQRLQEYELERAIRDEMVAYLETMLSQQCETRIASSVTAEKEEDDLQHCALRTKMATTARFLEHLLFQVASSLEAYCDTMTLKDRIKGISVKLLRRKLQKRQQMIVGARECPDKVVLTAKST